MIGGTGVIRNKHILRKNTSVSQKIGEFSPEYLIMKRSPEFSFTIKIQSTSISHVKRHIFKSSFYQQRFYYPEHLNFKCKNTPQNTFLTEQFPVALFDSHNFSSNFI